MNNLLVEIDKIGNRWVVLSILRCLRSKIEKSFNWPDRLDKHYPSGILHSLLIGDSGTGKTTIMKRIQDGFGLNEIHSATGLPSSLYFSMSKSTSRGYFELLANYKNAILFIDEINLDDRTTKDIFKSISAGQLLYKKHRSTEKIDFTGLVVGSTNGIKLDSNINHINALMDRFIIVNVQNQVTDNMNYFDRILEDEKINMPNWDLLIDAISNDFNVTLDDYEIFKIRSLWEKVAAKNLTGKSIYRQAAMFIDTFKFIKRFFGNLNDENFELGLEFANRTVHFTPLPILNLTPLQKILLNFIAGKERVGLFEILNECDKQGFVDFEKEITKELNKLVMSQLVFKLDNDIYTNKTHLNNQNNKEKSNLIKALSK